LEKAWRVDEPLNKYVDESLTQTEGTPMLWTIIVILVILWLLGFIGHVGGSLIHLLLVIAVIVLIINLIQGRRGL
jgi:preprotein translocase subunit SecF